MSMNGEQATTEAQFVEGPLWYLEFSDGSICVAEAEEEHYMLLFTTSEGARAFVAENEMDGESAATALLFSESEGQFRESAQRAMEGGIAGAVINPDGEEAIQTVVEFVDSSEEEEDEEE